MCLAVGCFFPPSVPSPFYFIRLLCGVFRFRCLGRSPGEPLGSPVIRMWVLWGPQTPLSPKLACSHEVWQERAGLQDGRGPHTAARPTQAPIHY